MIAIDQAPTLTGTPAAGVVGKSYRHAFTVTVTGQPAVTELSLLALFRNRERRACRRPGSPPVARTFCAACTWAYRTPILRSASPRHPQPGHPDCADA